MVEEGGSLVCCGSLGRWFSQHLSRVYCPNNTFIVASNTLEWPKYANGKQQLGEYRYTDSNSRMISCFSKVHSVYRQSSYKRSLNSIAKVHCSIMFYTYREEHKFFTENSNRITIFKKRTKFLCHSEKAKV